MVCEKRDELQHHGIKGMKWGRRRYQNVDGSLTPAGIKRYAQKGYEQDSYNNNKTKLGRAYDKVTGAHKYGGAALYGASSASERKARAEKYLADQKIIEDRKREFKEYIKTRSKEINAGKSFIGKVYNRYTGADRMQVELEYYDKKRR